MGLVYFCKGHYNDIVQLIVRKKLAVGYTLFFYKENISNNLKK